MTDAYIVGVDMIKFGRFPEKSVPQIGAEAALMALDDCGLTIQDMQALFCGNLGQGERDGRPTHPAADWPDRDTGRQLRERVRHGRDGVPRSLDFRQGGSLRSRHRGGCRTDGPRPARRPGQRQRYTQRRAARFGNHAVGVCGSRHGALAQAWNHLRTVRQGLGEEPSPRHDELEGDVPDRDAARNRQ